MEMYHLFPESHSVLLSASRDTGSSLRHKDTVSSLILVILYGNTEDTAFSFFVVIHFCAYEMVLVSLFSYI